MKNKYSLRKFIILFLMMVSYGQLTAASEEATFTYTSINSNSVQRYETVNIDFTMYDSSAQIIDQPLAEGSFNLKIYNSTGIDITAFFTERSVTYNTGVYGKISFKPQFNAPIGTGYYIGLSRSDDGTYFANEETTQNPGDLTDGQFAVDYADLHVEYIQRSPGGMQQADSTVVEYQYRIKYPDDSAEYTLNGSNLTVKVWDGAADVSSQFNIGTPVYDTDRWKVNIGAKATAVAKTGYTISVAKMADDTLNTTDSYKATDSTTADGDGNVALGTTDGAFAVTTGNPTITFLSRDNAAIQVADGSGVTYTWESFYVDGTTRVTDTEVLPSEWDIVVKNSALTDISSDYTIATPTYNSGSGQWSVNIQPLATAVVGNDYLISLEADSSASGAIIFEENSTVDLGTTNGVFDVNDADLSIDYAAVTAASIDRAGTIDTTYTFNLYYPDGTTEMSTDAASLTASVYDSSNADVSTDFNISAVSYNSTAFEVTISARETATVATGYYLRVSKTAGTTGDTLAAYNSNAGTSGNNSGLGAGGAFEVIGAQLAIQYSSLSSTSMQRADGSGITYQWDVVYPSGSDYETDDTGYAVTVRDSSNGDVTADFNVSAITYNSTHWQVNIQALAGTNTAETYHIEVSKTAGGEGDTMSAYASNAGTLGLNQGLGSPAGEFTVNNADLSITYVSRSTAAVEQGATSGITWQYRVFYPDGTTQETNDSGYDVKIMHGGSDVTADFETPLFNSYNGGASAWEVTVTPKSTTTVQSGYYLQVNKTAGGEGDTLAAYDSNAGTTGNNSGLGSPGGEFSVTNTALYIVYAGRNNAQIERSDGVGTDYTFNLYYPNGDEFTDGSDNGSLTVTVKDSSNATAAGFDIGTPVYASGAWSVNVKATNTPAVATGYYIEVSKAAGTSGETLVAYASNAGTSGSNTGLGATNGVFEVLNGKLYIEYQSLSANSIERAAASPITYRYQVFLPGTTTQETDDAGYQIKVYNSSATDVTAQFSVSGPVYTAGAWQVELTPADTATVQSGLYIAVSKAAGGDGRLEESSSYSNMSTSADPAGNLGLGSPGGEFEVTNATLAATWQTRNNAQIQRADGTGVTYTFNVYYGDGTTEEDNDTGYSLKVYNSADALVDTFGSGAATGTEFDYSGLSYSGGSYTFTLEALTTTTAATGYYVTIEKTAGGEGDTLAQTDSKNNTNLTATTGVFEVQKADLEIVYAAKTEDRIARYDGSTTVYTYNVYYPDGTTEATTDAANYVVTVHDASNADVSSEFNITGPVYGGGVWSVTLEGQSGVTGPETGYYLRVAKNAGTTGNTLAAYDSNAGTSGASQGLGAPAGEFEVTNLGVQFLSRDNAVFERADGTGVTYDYRLWVDNNISGTEVTAEAASQNVLVYNNAGTDVSGQFTIGTPTYSGGRWQVNIQATKNTATATGYYISVEKTPGSSSAIEEESRVDLGAAAGAFEVERATMNVTYLSRSDATFPRQNGAGTDYRFQVFYDDTTTEKNTGANDFDIRVFNSADTDVTGLFTVSTPNYNAGSWRVTVEANPSTPDGADFYISVRETGTGGDVDVIETASEALSYYATDGSESPANYTHRGLGPTDGKFSVTDAALTIHYTGTSLETPANPNIPANTFARNDGTGITYYYQIFYPDGITLKTDGDGYEVNVYDSSGTEQSGNFTIGSPVYNGACPIATTTGAAGCWSVNIQTQNVSADTTYWNDYRIGVLKTIGSDGDFMSGSGSAPTSGSNDDARSIVATDGAAPYDANSGLGTGNGVFDVTDETLTYLSRSTGTIQRADNGVIFAFRAFTPVSSGTEITADPLNTTTVRVYNASNVDVSAQFATSIVRNGSQYELTVKALPSTPVGTGYYVSLARNEGTTTDVILETFSNDTAQLDAGGVFEVTNANLTVKFTSDSIGGSNSFERADGTGITYNYKIFYPDGVTEKTAGDGYQIQVLNASDATDANTTGNFTVTPNGYSGGEWSVNIQSNDAATVLNDYKIHVYKDPGTDGDQILVGNAKLSDAATGTAADGGLGTGLNGGAFEVTNASLSIVFNSRTNAVIEQADNINVEYNFDVFYDDGATKESDDDGYQLTIYNTSDVAQDTFTLSAVSQTGTNFDVSALTSDGSGGWDFSIIPKKESPVGTGFYAAISKVAGSEGDTLAETSSTNGGNLNATSGVFEVTEASLNIVYQSRSAASLERGDSASITYTFNVYYDNLTDEEIIDASEYTVTVRDAANNNDTADFTEVSAVNYSGGVFSYEFTTKTTTTAAAGYYIEVTKAAGGTSGDTLAAYASNAPTAADADGNQGLAAGGAFEVTDANLVVTFVTRDVTSFERADGTGTTYNFTMQFKNGTYITDNSFGLPTAAVYAGTKSGTDRSSEFTIGSLVAPSSGNEWQVQLEALDTTTVDNDYSLVLEKTTGDLIAQKDATEDLGTGLTAGDGEFEVTNATLNLSYLDRNIAAFDRSDGVGTNYYYRVTYDDGTTEETDDSGYTVSVKNASDVDATADFTVSAPVYGNYAECGGGDCYRVNLQAKDSATPAAGYYLEISKTAGSEGDTLAVENSKDGDTLDATTGVFTVNYEDVLHVVYTGRSSNSFRRTDGNGVTFSYQVIYSDGVTQETDDASGYIFRIYNSADAVVETFNNVTAPVSGTNFDISALSYNSGASQWEVTFHGKSGTPVDQNYYMSIEKVGIAPAAEPDILPEFKSNASTTADAEGNTGLGSAGSPDDGEFDITNLRVDNVAVTNNPAEQRAAAADQTTYTFQVFNNEDTVSPLDNATLSAANFSVKLYDSSDTLLETFTAFPQAGSNFEISSLDYAGGNWSFKIKSYETSTVDSGYYVEIDYPHATGNALSTYNSKGTAEFEVIDATLHVVFNNRTVSEFEKSDGTGTDFEYNIYYDDGTEVTDSTTGNTGYVYKIYDMTSTEVTGTFDIAAASYTAGKWVSNVQAKLTVPSLDGYHFSISKTATGNNDTMAEFKSNESTTPDAEGNAGLGTTDGVFKVNNASLHIVYGSRTPATLTKGSSTKIAFDFKVYYKNGAEQKTEASAYDIKVYNSSGVDQTVKFNGTTTTYDSTTDNRWEVEISTTNLTELDNGYYLTVTRNAGSAGATLDEYASNASTTADVNGNAGLGATDGIFAVTKADLRIAYQNITNTAVQRLEDNQADAISYQWNVFYENNSEESNDSGYSVAVYDNTDTDVTAQFDFYNYNTTSYDSGAFNEPDHLKYESGRWNINIRPKNTAANQTGYYLVVSKAAGSEGDTLEPQTYTGLAAPGFASNSSTQSFANGTWTGLAATGEFEVTGAELSVKYIKTSYDDLTADNSHERSDGAGINWYFELYYPDGTAKDDSGSVDGFTAEVLNSTDSTDANTTGNFTVGAVSYDSGSGLWSFNVQASDAATVASDYRVQLSKAAGTDGDVISTAQNSTEATGTATDGGLAAGISGGEFEVKNATLNITFDSIANTSPEQGENEADSPLLSFNVYYDDGITEETDDNGYVLQVYDSSDTVVETLNLGSSAVTGTLFDATALTYAAGKYSVTVLPKAAATVATGYYFGISKTAGSEGDTIDQATGEAKTTIATDGSDSPAGYAHKGLAAPGFQVTEPSLNIVYQSRTTPSIEQGDTAEVVYKWRVFFDNLTEQATASAADYNIEIKNSSGVSQSTGVAGTDDFSISTALNYDGTDWVVGLKANSTASTDAADNNYYIEVSKAATTDGDTLAAFASNASTTADAEGNTGLGTGLTDSTEGEFEVTPATLTLTFTGLDKNTTQKVNPSDALTYEFTLEYANGEAFTSNASAGDLTVNVYRSNDDPITSAFNMGTTPTYDSGTGSWKLTMYPESTAIAEAGYYVTISKAAGTTAMIANEVSSKQGQSLDVGSGVFEVTATELDVVYDSVTTNTIQRADAAGLRYDFKILYPDASEETDDYGYTLKVYRNGSPDVLVDTFTVADSQVFPMTGSSFKLMNYAYDGGSSLWQAQLVSLAEAITGDHYITIEKGAGSEGDTTTAIASNSSSTADADGNKGLDSPGGEFALNAADLSIQYAVRSDSNGDTNDNRIERGTRSGEGIIYAFDVMFPDNATEATDGTDPGSAFGTINAANFDIKVYERAGGTDVSADFNIGTPAYSSTDNNWQVLINATKGAAIADDYYLKIEKANAAGDEDVLASYDSNASTTGNNTGLDQGLGAGQGEFGVENATLAVVYQSRSANSTARADGTGVDYFFSIEYPSGEASENEESDIDVKVYLNSPSDESANFTIGSIAYSNYGSGAAACGAASSCYKVNVEPNVTAQTTDATHPGSEFYYLSVTKNAGTSGDVAAEAFSQSGSSLDTTTGTFDVSAAKLKIVYGSRSNATIQRADGTGTSFTFNAQYPDDTNETDDYGYVIKVKKKADDSAAETFNITSGATYPLVGGNGQFKLNNLANTTGTWQADIIALSETSLEDYYISVEKTAGGEGDYSDEVASNSSPLADPDGDTGLDSPGGEFTIEKADLHIVFTGRADSDDEPSENAAEARIERGTVTGKGITYSFKVYYPDGVTEATDGTDPGTAYGTVDAANFTLAIKDAGGDETANFNVGNSGDETSLSPAYDGGSNSWQVLVRAKKSAAAQTDYFLEVNKTATATDEDTLAALASNASTTADASGNTGLGSGLGMVPEQGEFAVVDASLHIVYIERGPRSNVEIDGNNTNIYYRILYDNGEPFIDTDSAGSEQTVLIKNDDGGLTGGPDFTAYFNSTKLVPAYVNDATCGAYSYTGGNADNQCWSFEIEANTAGSVPEDNDTYYTEISKPAGTSADVLATYASNASTTADANGNIGLGTGLDAAAGEFEVREFDLRVRFLKRSSATAQQGDSTAVDYYYYLFNPGANKTNPGDDVEEIDDSTANIEAYSIKVYSGGGSDVSSDFTIGTPVYVNSDTECSTGTAITKHPGGGSPFEGTNDCFKVSITPTVGATVATGYYISIGKSERGTTNDRLKETLSNIAVESGDNQVNSGLGTDGEFEVTDAVLTVTWLGKNANTVEHHTDAPIEYVYKTMYPNGIDEESVDAAQQSIKVYDSGDNDVTSMFEIGSPVYTTHSQCSSGQCWVVNVKPLSTAPLATGYYLGLEKTSGGTSGETTAAESLSTGGTNLDTITGVFAVIEATVSVAFQEVAPKSIEPGEEVGITVAVTYKDGTLLPAGNLTAANITAHKIEDQSNQTALYDFTIENLDDGRYKIKAKAKGGEYSKVGEYLQLSGSIANGDSIANVSSYTQLEMNGVWVVAKETILHQNFPNPFNPAEGEKTQIRFDLVGSSGDVLLQIYTVDGRLVREFTGSDIVNNQRVFWDGKNQAGQTVASGIYYAVLKVDGYKKTIKIAVIK